MKSLLSEVIHEESIREREETDCLRQERAKRNSQRKPAR